MFAKVLCLAAVMWSVSAQTGHGHGHQVGHSSQYLHKHDGHAQLVTFKDKHGHEHHDYYTHPEYKFGYKVEDHHTGDIKNQEEHRHGDKVTGVYSLHEKDGSVRKVEYHSDKKTGFEAIVKHETHHIVPEKPHYHHESHHDGHHGHHH